MLIFILFHHLSLWGVVDLSKYPLQQSAQLVVPFHHLKVTLTFCLCFSRFKILYDTLQIYRSTLSSLYLCSQHIKLILSDGSHVVHTQHVGCHHLLTVKYRKIAHIVIEKGCSCPSMLDFWMPTHIVGGTKNAI